MHSKFHDYYRIHRLLGEGSYGNVYEAEMLPPRVPSSSSTYVHESIRAQGPEPRRVAAKCFVLSCQAQEHNAEAERALRELAARRASFERERSILARLEHPHLVKMYECFEDKDHLWIVLELCRGGELYERIADRVRTGSSGLDEDLGRVFFRQMLLATSYLHASRVVHRDVKTENFLLLGEDGSRHGEVLKLCDFGTAVQLTAEQPRAMDRIGTLSYTAPEVYAKRGANVLADAWSLGVVLYVLLVGASPFRTTGQEPREETVRRIQDAAYDQQRPAWQGLSEAAQDLVRRLLVVDEGQRLTSAQALEHPWVQEALPRVRLGSQAGPAGAAAQQQLAERGGGKDTLRIRSAQASLLLQLFRRFACLDAMQQLVLIVCAQMTSEAEIMRCKRPVPWYDLFFALDANQDGRIDFAELVQGLRLMLDSSSGYSDLQLDALVRALDLDCSGTVDWVEWVAVALLSSQSVWTEPEPLRTVFRLLDRPSGDGTIGAADLLAVINSDAVGRSFSTVHGRDQIHRIISKWVSAPPPPRPSPPGLQEGGSGRNLPRRRRPAPQGPTPSLALADLQRVLEAAVAGGQTPNSGDGDCFHWCSGQSPGRGGVQVLECAQVRDGSQVTVKQADPMAASNMNGPALHGSAVQGNLT